MLQMAKVPFESVTVAQGFISNETLDGTAMVLVGVTEDQQYRLFNVVAVCPGVLLENKGEQAIEIIELEIWKDLKWGQVLEEPFIDEYGNEQINLTTLMAHPDWI